MDLRLESKCKTHERELEIRRKLESKKNIAKCDETSTINKNEYYLATLCHIMVPIRSKSCELRIKMLGMQIDKMRYFEITM